MAEERPVANLTCKNCGRVLADVYMLDRRTCLLAYGTNASLLVIHRATVVCPNCHDERRFNSDPMLALRLGVTE